MTKRFSRFLIKLWGWKYTKFPDLAKAVVIMAPHTSIFDFVWGKIYFSAHGIKPTILVKKEVFFFPVGQILRRLGAMPVNRGKKTGITEMSIELFNEIDDKFFLVITPEGTRKATKYWKKGFARIAKAANVPVALGYIDYKKHIMGVMDVWTIGDDEEIETFIEKVKKEYIVYSDSGLRKNKFITGYENNFNF
jgi:1-acyl-sn-glycerol-3-phosphate acyltransferase